MPNPNLTWPVTGDGRISFTPEPGAPKRIEDGTGLCVPVRPNVDRAGENTVTDRPEYPGQYPYYPDPSSNPPASGGPYQGGPYQGGPYGGGPYQGGPQPPYSQYGPVAPGGYPFRHRVEMGEAFSKGWNAFIKRFGFFITMAAIPAALTAVIYFALGIPIGGFAFGNFSSFSTGEQRLPVFNSARIGVAAGAGLALIVVSIFIGLYRAQTALDAVDENPRGAGSLLGAATRRFWAYVGWSILAGLLVIAGLLALCVGALVVGCMMQWVGMLAIERSENPIRDSWNGIKDNLGPPVVVFVIAVFGGAIVNFALSAMSAVVPVVGAVLQQLVAGLLGGYLICINAVLYRGSPVNLGGGGSSQMAVPYYLGPTGPAPPAQPGPPAPPPPPPYPFS